MVPIFSPIEMPAAVLLIAAGVFLLRRAWTRRHAAAPVLTGVGWLCVLGGTFVFARNAGPLPGIAIAMLCLSLVAYVVIAAGMELRPARAGVRREVALAPEERRTTLARGSAKAFLAIVLSGIASIGLGVAYALRMPLDTHDRIIIGGVLVPVLWGAGMAWTLCDAKLLRATIVLLSLSALGYGAAFLPKLLP